MSKHTPGPWHAEWGHRSEYGEPEGSIWIVDAHGNEVPFRFDEEPEERANARLIAAAPELLAALRDMVELHEDEPERPAVVVARRALARATGGGE